ncbi:LysR substrate-binding domain-containing protein [Niveibacterium sp. SC-1]|uniref:LysR family transcriptional regulator n=1 Tax=Niveibacterium sp. SC-1 TaxID=3135646 RepID=UPI00311E2AE3
MSYGINDLKVFVAVAEGGNLSAAARRMKLTPAAVSAVLKRLEAAVGARLLERSSRACRLTDAGGVFLDAARHSLETLRGAEAAVQARVREPSGLVRISAPTDLARSLLGEWLDEFQQRHPKVALSLTVSDSVQDLLSDSLDVAVRYGRLPDSALVAKPLRMTRRLTCASPDYLARHGTPRVPADLAQHNCLRFSVGGRLDSVWQYSDGGEGETLVRQRVSGDRASDDSALVKLWALQGRGLINKSDLDLVREIETGWLVPVLQDFPGPKIPLSLVFASTRQMPAAVRVLADFLVERATAAVLPA